MTITRFSFPTTIHFGPGARRLVADHLRGQGCRRPLVVTATDGSTQTFDYNRLETLSTDALNRTSRSTTDV